MMNPLLHVPHAYGFSVPCRRLWRTIFPESLQENAQCGQRYFLSPSCGAAESPIDASLAFASDALQIALSRFAAAGRGFRGEGRALCCQSSLSLESLAVPETLSAFSSRQDALSSRGVDFEAAAERQGCRRRDIAAREAFRT